MAAIFSRKSQQYALLAGLENVFSCRGAISAINGANSYLAYA
jgi:hypothetical protein